jgi:leucyl/phenylalanyl-tRNA--protein transferase
MSRAIPPLDPDLLLRAYTIGVFPMADSREAPSVYWVEPRERAVLPLDGFHLSKSLRKTLRADRYETTSNHAFRDIVRLCAEAAPDRPATWINSQIEAGFVTLHQRGHAHSIETWSDGVLVGGLYGLSLGRAFFGESMVSRAPDASKVALAHLVARLRTGGYSLLDCQFMTPHLASLGALEVSRDDYMELLEAAVSDSVSEAASGGAAGDWRAFDRVDEDGASSVTVSGPPSGCRIVQALVHTS